MDGSDNIIPASLNQTNFKVFAVCYHYLLGQQGWEEIADYCMEWIAQTA